MHVECSCDMAVADPKPWAQDAILLQIVARGGVSVRPLNGPRHGLPSHRGLGHRMLKPADRRGSLPPARSAAPMARSHTAEMPLMDRAASGASRPGARRAVPSAGRTRPPAIGRVRVIPASSRVSCSAVARASAQTQDYGATIWVRSVLILIVAPHPGPSVRRPRRHSRSMAGTAGAPV